MDIVLVIIALVLGVAGFLNLSQATMGVGLIAIGCLAGIVARIVQASNHQKMLMGKLAGNKDITIDKV